MFANRNGFFYTIDRVTGKVIVAKPFVETTWAKEIDPDGRPGAAAGAPAGRRRHKTCPDLAGGTNFMSPSFDPTTRLFFVTARETCATYFGYEQTYKLRRSVHRRRHAAAARSEELRRAARHRSDHRRTQVGVPLTSTSASGVLTTASSLVFAADGDGNLMAFDSRTGKMLWHYQLGARCDDPGTPTWSTAGSICSCRRERR